MSKIGYDSLLAVATAFDTFDRRSRATGVVITDVADR